MALYCTTDDMIDLFGFVEMTQISNLDNPIAQAPDEDRITRAIAQASGEIDRYLTSQVKYPITSEMVLNILKGVCADICRYILESRGEPRPDVLSRYKSAIDWLLRVSKGEINLTEFPASENVADSAIAFGSEPRVFTRDSLDLYTRQWFR